MQNSSIKLETYRLLENLSDNATWDDLIVLQVKSSFFVQKNFNWEYLSYPGISLKCLK